MPSLSPSKFLLNRGLDISGISPPQAGCDIAATHTGAAGFSYCSVAEKPCDQEVAARPSLSSTSGTTSVLFSQKASENKGIDEVAPGCESESRVQKDAVAQEPAQDPIEKNDGIIDEIEAEPRDDADEVNPPPMKMRKIDPVKAAERAAKTQEKNLAKQAALEAKKAEKIAAKAEQQKAKEKAAGIREATKTIGDAIKSSMKGKKKWVNGYRTYSVPGYPTKRKRDNSETTVSLGHGQVQEIFGVTKCKGGSMYAQFEICSANVTYNYGYRGLKMTYKTTETF